MSHHLCESTVSAFVPMKTKEKPAKKLPRVRTRQSPQPNDFKIKIRRWRSVRFSPAVTAGPTNPLFKDFNETAFGKRALPKGAMHLSSEHPGPPAGPTSCFLPTATARASRHPADITRMTSRAAFDDVSAVALARRAPVLQRKDPL
jgi:hypothetical protein